MRYFRKLKSNKGADVLTCFETPCSCPRCHSAIEPIFLHGYLNDVEKGLLSIFLHCNGCKNTFISSYQCDGTISYDYSDYLAAYLLKSEPLTVVEKEFSTELTTLSPDFVKIYNQSFIAEQSGLNDICGIGYRKAIEYLVKDYSIKISPTDKDTIKSKPLSEYINTCIDNRKIKSLALASAWLGNDQTHYEQRITDAGIKEMKAFIMALVNFIDSDLQADIATNLINSKKSA